MEILGARQKADLFGRLGLLEDTHFLRYNEYLVPPKVLFEMRSSEDDVLRFGWSSNDLIGWRFNVAHKSARDHAGVNNGVTRQ